MINRKAVGMEAVVACPGSYVWVLKTVKCLNQKCATLLQDMKPGTSHIQSRITNYCATAFSTVHSDRYKMLSVDQSDCIGADVPSFRELLLLSIILESCHIIS
jgi:hypothetical protein